MPREMMEARSEDVLRALDRLEETIQFWKDAVRAGEANMSIARGPFPPIPIPGPPPPFTDCRRIEFLSPPPLTECVEYDIDTYVQQVSGLFMGLYYGLLHDQGGDLSP